MAGFSYIEVLVAIVLIVVSLVPALQALSTGIKANEVHEHYSTDHYLLAARMETVLAEPFDRLDEEAVAVNDPDTPTAYSDTVSTPDGRTLTRQVYLSRYDGDNADGDDDFFSDTDEGLLWVRVEIEGTAMGMERLTSVYE